MQSKYVLWKSNSLEMIKPKKSPSACAMVWNVASDKGIHSRASSHKPMRCAKSSLHAASTHSCTTCKTQTVAIFKYQEKTPSGDSMYRHVLPASISKGKLTSTMTTVIARVLLPAYCSCSRAAARCSNPKDARHAVALHNSQRPHAHFLALPQDVCRPLRSRHQRRDYHQGASLDPTNRPSGDASTWSNQRSSIPM